MPFLAGRRWALRRAIIGVALTVLMMGLWAPSVQGASSSPAAGRSSRPIPLLAYYYIWFNTSSWNRAKIDYPLIGRYSSSNVSVMRSQVAQAKQAGITGFLVSWKDTPVLDRRLAALVKVSAAAGFKLGIVLEGLDFLRNPLPMSEVSRSFGYLEQHYAGNPVFNLFGKPVVVWSGTWKYTTAQKAAITGQYGSQLTILASEKQPAAYAAVSHLFAGDAYYWSSVDPLHTPGYKSKLDTFSSTVHSHGGLWIAPAAPGYDARLIGGTRVIPRRGGQTLRLEMNAAMASSPDAVGLISWNEFSENTYIEPSRNYGSAALQTVTSVAKASPAAIPNFDSNGPSGATGGPGRFVFLGVIAVVLIGSASAIVLREVRRR